MSMMTPHPLKPKSRKISWDNNYPYSIDYEDRFFQSDAIAETEEVFLRANNLSDRWKKDKSKNFTIGELGFGFGLNFLITAKNWHQQTSKESKKWLDYISIDSFALNIEDFQRVTKDFPELKEFSQMFIDSFPIEVNGYTRISYPKYRIRLTLIVDDVDSALQSLLGNDNNKIDAWYLDGFDPKKNTNMWSDDIFSKISALSKNNTTFGTYTAAGFVRRGLEKHNFKVDKVKGFKNKRHKLQGIFSQEKKYCKNQYPSKVAIIGAGIAGSCLAFNLAKNNIEVDVFDKNIELNANPMASMYPKFSFGVDPRSYLLVQGYFHSFNFYIENLNSFSNTGILFLNNNAERDFWIKRIAKLNRDDLFKYLSAEEINSQNNIDQKFNGILIKYGANISINELNNELLKNKKINVFKNHEFVKYEQDSSIKAIFKEAKEYEGYSHLVICSGESLQEIVPRIGIKYGAIAGIDDKSLKNIKYPINADGYILPKHKNVNWTGSIYSDKALSKDVPLDFESIIVKNSYLLKHKNVRDIKESWIGTRATLPDYLPMAGALEDKIYAIGGLGSRGLSLAPLLAEVIMCDICNIPSPISKNIKEAINPLRFI